MIHSISQPPATGIRVTAEQMRGRTVVEFVRSAKDRGYAVAQHRAAFYLVRVH